MKKPNLFLSTIAVLTLIISLQTLSCLAQPGSLDLTFGTGGKVTTPIGTGAEGHSVAMQSDGKIVVGGMCIIGGNWDFALIRYNSDGSLDNTFGTGGKTTTDFGASGDLGYSVVIQSNGKIVVAGSSVSDFALARYNSDGSLDNTFGTGGKLTTDFGGADQGYSVAIQSNGKIVVAGNTNNGGSNIDFALARYNSDGSLDNTFDTDGKVTTDFGTSTDRGYSVAIQSDGKIVVVGERYVPNYNNFALARYNSDGSLDNTFDTDGKVTTDVSGSGVEDLAYSVALQSDGNIVVAGYSYSGGGWNSALVRYNTNGSLDNTFGTGGIVTTYNGGYHYIGNSVTIQGDGKIILAGVNGYSNYDFGLIRYNSNGSLDNSFGTGGIVGTPIGSTSDIGYAVALQSDGNIVEAGYTDNGGTNDFAVVRYNVCTSVPTVNANATATTVCSGTSVTLTGSGTAISYTWSGGVTDGIGFNPTTTTTYTVTGANVSGCQNKAATTITVNPLPTVNANASPSSTICTGTTVTFTGSGSATSYAWSGGVTNGIGFVPTSTATYTVTGTDGNSCSKTTTTTITVNPIPTVTANATATTVCAGTSVTLTGSGTATSYVWSGGITNGIGFAPTSTATYTVTGTDVNGCKGTDAINITVNPLPTITAGTGTYVCTGNSATLTATGGVNYVWSASAQTTTSIVVSPTVSTSYTVTGTDANGCSNSASQIISVNPLPVQPTAFTASSTSICVPQSGVIYTVPNDPTVSYAWNYSGTGATIIGSTNSVSVNFSAIAASGTLSVTAINSCGTSASRTVAVTVNTAPSANIGLDTLWVCNGDVLTFSLTSTTGVSAYSITNGYQTSNNNPLSFTYNSTQALVQSNVTGTNGCTSQDVIHLMDNTIINLFQLTPTNNDPSYVFNAATPLPAMVDSWKWDFGDGATQAGGLTAPHTYTANGTYTVCIIGMNECDTAIGACWTIPVTHVGIEEYLLNNSISIFPVPNKGEFTIKNDSPHNIEIEIENIVGEKIVAYRISRNISKVICSELTPGMYMVKITNDSGVRVARKIVIEK